MNLPFAAKRGSGNEKRDGWKEKRKGGGGSERGSNQRSEQILMGVKKKLTNPITALSSQFRRPQREAGSPAEMQTARSLCALTMEFIHSQGKRRARRRSIMRKTFICSLFRQGRAVVKYANSDNTVSCPSHSFRQVGNKAVMLLSRSDVRFSFSFHS